MTEASGETPTPTTTPTPSHSEDHHADSPFEFNTRALTPKQRAIPLHLPTSESILGASPAWARRTSSPPDFDTNVDDNEDTTPTTTTTQHEEVLQQHPQQNKPSTPSSSSPQQQHHRHPFNLSPAPTPAVSILPTASPVAFIRRSTPGIPTKVSIDTPHAHAHAHSPSLSPPSHADSLLAQPPSPSIRLSTSLPSWPTAYPPFLTSSKVATLTEDSISVLPQKLVLVSLRNENSDQCLRALLQLAFFSPGGFFSVTQTEDELSLIVDEKSLSLFPSEAIEVCPGCWRAIQVYEGPEAIQCSGVIAMLSGAITKAGINVIYLSTFNTDLLLVDEGRLDEAYGSLKKTLQRLSLGSPPTFSAAKAERQKVSNAGDDVALVLSPFPKRLTLVCMSQELLIMHTHAVLNLLLSTLPFFSLTLLNKEEVALVVDEDHAEYFLNQVETGICVHPSRWRGIQIDLGSIALDVAAVTVLADILAEEEIAIYYLSTYTTDFVLVQDTKVDAALAIVNQRLSQRK